MKKEIGQKPTPRKTPHYEGTATAKNDNGPLIQVVRTTLVLPVTLDQNLELYAVKAGLPKGEVIKRVLIEYLTKQGFQPDKRPTSINVVY